MFHLPTVIIYICTLLSFLWYLSLKYKKRNYLVSSMNIGLFTYAFILFFMPFVFVSDKAWHALGITIARSMEGYLNQSMLINLAGFFVMICSLAYFELYAHKTESLERKINGIQKEIRHTVLNAVFYCVVFLWYAVVFTFNGGIPLFNQGRAFFLNTGISPVYMALNEIMLMYAMYYGLQFAFNKIHFMNMLISLATVAFAAHRGPLVNVIESVGIIAAYAALRGKAQKINVGKSSKRRGRKATGRIILLSLVLLAGGLSVGLLRGGGKIKVEAMAQEIFFGNTFSDVRDGAFILKGFKENWNQGFLHGKTYLAGALSFIPSSLSEFRTAWSFGRFTTVALFNMRNHFGLRGGNAMEAYLNFGWAGVIVMSIIQGYVSALLERLFCHFFYSGRHNVTGKECFAIGCISALGSWSVCTSGAFALYVDALFLMLVLSLSRLVPIEIRTKRIKMRI